MNKTWSTLCFSILHFLVDGVCALVIFSSLYNDSYSRCLAVFLIYNFLAFLSQPLVGLSLDYFPKPKVYLGIAIFFLFLGVIFQFQYIVSAILLGIGNSFFHVSGGKYLVNKTNNDIRHLGIFVSTGAIGLCIGQYFFSQFLLYFFLICMLIVTICFVTFKEKEDSSFEQIEIKYNSYWWVCLFFLIFVVFIRSFIGKIIVIDFSTTVFTFLAISLATAFGKAIGGFLVQYLKVKWTIILSMGIAFFCFLFGYKNIYFLCIGVIAFNVTMPITLWYVNHLLPKYQGFAFGLLAAVLIPGYLLGMLEITITLRFVLIALFSLFSFVFVLMVERWLPRCSS